MRLKCNYCGKSWSVSFIVFMLEYYFRRRDDGVYIKHFRCHNCFEDNCKWVDLRLVNDSVNRDRTRGGRE